jgi:chemotaxis protein CheX
MLGEKITEITTENQDACAEICNQVFGMAKQVLNQSGYNIQPAIPSIVVGDNHRIRHVVDGICIAVEFSTEAGNFTVEAAVN